MTRVMVEHPIEEAEALLKRLGSDPLTPEDVERARVGRERLEKAVRVERAASGSAEVPPELVRQAKELIDQDVRILTGYGERSGVLREVFATCALIIEVDEAGPALRRTIPMAHVISVKPVEELAETAA